MNNRNKYKGIIGLTQKEYENEFNGFYVYAHIYIPTNEILYIGKGCRRRCLSFNRREYYDLRDDIEIDIIARFDNEEEALKCEEQEVFYYKYIGQAKYNSDSFCKGKCRGEVAISTDTVEADIEDKYDLTPRNIKLHQMELNMVRDIQCRENLKNLMSSLKSYTSEEIKEMVFLYEQLLNRQDECEDYEIMCYKLFLRHLKKI